ncbi:MAG: hypothetical protein IJ841_06465 [Prevotella sp.]|nr:hypothetical protein [Prevotella sp.]
MKKKYLRPSMTEVNIALTGPIASSGLYSEDGLEWGGRDENGTMDPKARQRRFWDDDE